MFLERTPVNCLLLLLLYAKFFIVPEKTHNINKALEVLIDIFGNPEQALAVTIGDMKKPEKEHGKCPPETEVLLQGLLDLAPVINTAKLLKKMNRNLKNRGAELIPISEGIQLNGIWVKEAISQLKELDKSNAGLQKCSIPTQVGKSPTGNANVIHEIRYNNVVPKAIYSL